MSPAILRQLAEERLAEEILAALDQSPAQERPIEELRRIGQAAVEVGEDHTDHARFAMMNTMGDHSPRIGAWSIVELDRRVDDVARCAAEELRGSGWTPRQLTASLWGVVAGAWSLHTTLRRDRAGSEGPSAFTTGRLLVHAWVDGLIRPGQGRATPVSG